MPGCPFRSTPASLLMAACLGVAAVIVAPPLPARAESDIAPQERQCMERGWQRVALHVAGLPRVLLWKAQAGAWTRGAILVLHGGGGRHFHWCVANAPIVAPQLRFAELALADGFAVFLLDSSSRVTDNEGRACGKVWDDEVRARANLDLPFIGEVIRDTVPLLRPRGSRTEIFLAGLSSGGFMAVRAATHLGDLVTAFAPVSSGDPYGWHRVCEAGMTPRTVVHGAGFDNETGRMIVEFGACRADTYPREKRWDVAPSGAKPAFRIFHHEMDGIVDVSCSEKLDALLRRHGYPGPEALRLRGGARGLANHLWQDAYSRPLLDFFAAQLAPGRR
jgi:pimeloyl-ACP methyl ester carboxylesterase